MDHVTREINRLEAELQTVVEAILEQDPDGALRIHEVYERAYTVVARRKADLKGKSEPRLTA